MKRVGQPKTTESQPQRALNLSLFRGGAKKTRVVGYRLYWAKLFDVMVAVLSNRPEIHLERKSQSDVYINGDSTDIPDFVSSSKGRFPRRF